LGYRGAGEDHGHQKNEARDFHVGIPLAIKQAPVVSFLCARSINAQRKTARAMLYPGCDRNLRNDVALVVDNNSKNEHGKYGRSSTNSAVSLRSRFRFPDSEGSKRPQLWKGDELRPLALRNGGESNRCRVTVGFIHARHMSTCEQCRGDVSARALHRVNAGSPGHAPVRLLGRKAPSSGPQEARSAAAYDAPPQVEAMKHVGTLGIGIIVLYSAVRSRPSRRAVCLRSMVQGPRALLENHMPAAKWPGTRALGRDIQREQLGPRGVPEKVSPTTMTPQRNKKTPKNVDPGHSA
jgi:hypothetical protein